jgi:mRNA interferase MazF
MTRRFTLQKGDVVLTKFPYSNLSGHKLRPAVIVSPGFIGQEVIAIPVSTVLRGAAIAPYDIQFDATNAEFSQSGLRFPSALRADKLVTLDESLLLRRLGKLGVKTILAVDMQLRKALSL